MNTKCFVTGSSVILAGWLGATFLKEVPSQRYPKLDKKTAASEPEMESADAVLNALRDLPTTVAR
jgi:hypothetical protein